LRRKNKILFKEKEYEEYVISFVLAVFFISFPVVGGINEGLVSHWTFDETSGTTAYDSAGTNDGALNGGRNGRLVKSAGFIF